MWPFHRSSPRVKGRPEKDVEEGIGRLQEEDESRNTVGNLEQEPANESSSSKITQQYMVKQGETCVASNETEDSSKDGHHVQRRSLLISVLILTLGLAASGAFLAVGITAAQKEQEDQFERVAKEYVNQLENDWTDYETAGLWTHQSTRQSQLNATISRLDFTELYENLLADGLDFQAICWLPNVSQGKRQIYEEEAMRYYSSMNSSAYVYTGFKEYQSTTKIHHHEEDFVSRSSDHDFYFPIHYIEPFQGNEEAIGLDMYSVPAMVPAIEKSIRTYSPTASSRALLHSNGDQATYGIYLLHPGIQVSALPNMKATDLSLMEIRIPSLLERTTKDFNGDVLIYIYDTTPWMLNPKEQFLGAVSTTHPRGGSNNLRLVERAEDVEEEEQKVSFQYLPEKQLDQVWNDSGETKRKRFKCRIGVADRSWTVVVLASNKDYRPNVTFVILGGVLIFVACTFLAWWEWSNKRRTAEYNELQHLAQAERQALIAETAFRKRERDLNDYMAHEIRNPVAAAISANHFVKEAIDSEEVCNLLQSRTDKTSNETKTREENIRLDDGGDNKEGEESQETLKILKEDVAVVDNALHFVYDLLRTMLDMHRASNNQLQVDMKPVHLLTDVLEPVHSMLCGKRDSQTQVLLECPEDLLVVSDPLRLKQIILNLGRNSSKFVEKGFIRLKAEVQNSNVLVSVEDSGVGVPESKHNNLFEKFQESLDSLNQGTGIGLYLCKDLSALLGCDLYFDKEYHSGIEGSPGARFVVDLKRAPYSDVVDTNAEASIPVEDPSIPVSESQRGVPDMPTDETAVTPEQITEVGLEIPPSMSVLFVDDDYILRRLFSRSVRKAFSGWKVKDAANGETAIQLCKTETFDLIFMDMYMTSVERQLLGTETVRALRSNGVKSIICGLSANDMRQNFLDSGADAFMMKPFPCEADALKQEIHRVLFGAEGSTESTASHISSNELSI